MKNMNLLRKISEMCHGKGKKMVKLRRCKRCSKFKKEFKKNPGDLQNDCYKIVSCTATSVKLKRVPVFQAHTSDQVSIIRAGVVGQQLDSPLHFAPANDPLLLNGDFSYVFSQLNNQMPQIENEPTNFEIERQNNGQNITAPSVDYDLENDSWNLSKFYYDSYIRFPSIDML